MGLINNIDKEKIKRAIPKPANKIITVAVVRLYIAYPDPKNWTYTGLSGALALVDDLVGHTFFLKLVDISGSAGVLWDQELYIDFQYHQDRIFFHSFELDDCYAGFLFADESEASHFLKKVQHREKYASKATINNKNAIALKRVAESQKGPAQQGPRGDPTGTRNRVHLNTGVVYYDDQPPVEWRPLYAELASQGITEEMIADNREFIKQYIRQQGGPLVGLEPPIPRKYQSLNRSDTIDSSYSASTNISSPVAAEPPTATRRARAPPPPPPSAASGPSTHAPSPPSTSSVSLSDPNDTNGHNSDAESPESSTPASPLPRRVPPPMPFIGSHVPARSAPPSHSAAAPTAPPISSVPAIPSLPPRTNAPPAFPPLPAGHPSGPGLTAAALQDRPLPAPPSLPPRTPLLPGTDYSPVFGSQSPAPPVRPVPASPYGTNPYQQSAPNASGPPPPPPPRIPITSTATSTSSFSPPPPPPSRASGFAPPPPPSRGTSAVPASSSPYGAPATLKSSPYGAPATSAPSPYGAPTSSVPSPYGTPAASAPSSFIPPPPPKTPNYPPATPSEAPPPAPPALPNFQAPSPALPASNLGSSGGPPPPPPPPPSVPNLESSGGPPPPPPVPNLGSSGGPPPPPSVPNLGSSGGPPPPPPVPNLGSSGAPPPPPPPNLGGASPSAPSGDIVNSDRSALFASIRTSGGINGLKKVDKAHLDRPSALLLEAKGQAPPPSANPAPGGGPASLADALAVALNKRKNQVGGSDDEDDNDDW